MIFNVNEIKRKLNDFQLRSSIHNGSEKLFAFDENSTGCNVILEKLDGKFKLYLNGEYSGNDFNGLYSYYSVIKFDKHEAIIIKAHLKGKLFYFYLFCIIFIVVFNIFLILKRDFTGLFFLVPILVGMVAEKIRKHKFKKFIKDFLNNL